MKKPFNSKQFSCTSNALLSLLFCSLFFTIYSQAPGVCWQKKYGSSSSDDYTFVLPLANGRILTAFGSVGSDNDLVIPITSPTVRGGIDVVVMELDACGTIIWKKIFGGSRDDTPYALKTDSIGNIFIGGQTYSSGGDAPGFGTRGDLWAIKLDPTGTVLWRRALGTGNVEYGGFLDIAENGDALITGIAGLSWNPPGYYANNDAVVVRLNGATGATVWQKCYGGTAGERGFGIKSTADNGGILLAFTNSSANNTGNVSGTIGSNDVWVVKFDAASNFQWQKCLGGSGDDGIGGGDIIEDLSDSTYVVFGVTNSTDFNSVNNHGAQDILGVKLDKLGNVIWSNCFGGSNGEYMTRSTNATIISADGNYVVVGASNSNDGNLTFNSGGSDGWIFKVDKNTGALIWDKVISTTGNDIAYSVAEISQGNYIVGMSTTGSNSLDFDQTSYGATDAWIVRLSDDCLGPLYQNVTSSVVNTSCDLNNGSISINVPNRVIPNDYAWISPAGIQDTISSLSNLPNGTYALEVTDFIGCKDTFSAIVAPIADTIAPFISMCVPDQVHYVDANCVATLGNYASSPLLLATDNCRVDSIYQFPAVGSILTIGDNTVSIVVMDEAENADTCSFIVHVLDTIAPVVSGCPTDIVQYLGLNNCDVAVNWIAPSATDACGAVTSQSSHVSGAVFAVGSTQVVYTFTDVSGNDTTCTFTVNVLDTVPPTLANCPTDLNLYLAPSNCQVVATWSAPTMTDNCTTWTSTSTHQSGSSFEVGTTPVVYTFTDQFGNDTTCVFSVNVFDTLPHDILNCPSTIVVYSNANSCDAIATWGAPTLSNNCGNWALSSNYTSGSVFVVGSYVVDQMFISTTGDTVSCSFNIDVRDTIAPVISYSINNTLFCQGVPISWSFDADDNCGITTLVSNPSNTTVLPVGISPITITATDVNGNTSSLSFSVTVQAMPTLELKTDTIHTCKGNAAVLEIVPPNSAYNYQWLIDATEVGTGSTYTIAANSLSNNTEVTVIATDVAGCSSEEKMWVILQNCEVVVPEIFTPNGDQENEVFYIEYLDQFPNSKIEILNRWGTQVYQSDNYKNDWNGVSQSNLNVGNGVLPEGTYYYVLTLGGDSGLPEVGKNVKGFVYLKR